MCSSAARSVARSATIFAALGDPTRLELVSRLGDGRHRSIAQLGDGLELTRQGVTKHLQKLKQAGIVSCKRSGRETLFSIEPGSIEAARDYLSRAAAQWDEAIVRLRGMVEEE